MNAHFRRPVGTRRYKRMFVIVAEGTVTEHEYFSLLNEESIVHVKCLKNPHNLPPKEALEKVQKYVREEKLKRIDEAWVVVDKDLWLDVHFSELHAWAQTRANYGFALSNPKFEYWLLLHFEDANGVTTSADCDRKLAKYLRDYDKHVSAQVFNREKVKLAATRARKRDTPPCTDWPHKPGTTIYKLVEKILESRTS